MILLLGITVKKTVVILWELSLSPLALSGPVTSL